jgi:BMFP domain-containing protein YqiC
MTQTTGRFFDEIGKLITDAAGAADGMRKEIENLVRSQAERVLRDLDVVQREEFEAIKAMAQKAREENEALKEKIAALEASIVKGLVEQNDQPS